MDCSTPSLSFAFNAVPVSVSNESFASKPLTRNARYIISRPGFAKSSLIASDDGSAIIACSKGPSAIVSVLSFSTLTSTFLAFASSDFKLAERGAMLEAKSTDAAPVSFAEAFPSQLTSLPFSIHPLYPGTEADTHRNL
ncbi:hypothetical protein D9M68_777650 [compost metagenome]